MKSDFPNELLGFDKRWMEFRGCVGLRVPNRQSLRELAGVYRAVVAGNASSLFIYDGASGIAPGREIGGNCARLQGLWATVEAIVPRFNSKGKCETPPALARS